MKDPFYTDKLLTSLQEDGIQAIQWMAKAYLTERKWWEERVSFLKNWNLGIMYGNKEHGTSTLNIEEFRGSSMMRARADSIITLMIANVTDKNPFKYWVEIAKDRAHGPSRHSFPTLQAAINFIREFTK